MLHFMGSLASKELLYIFGPACGNRSCASALVKVMDSLGRSRM